MRKICPTSSNKKLGTFYARNKVIELIKLVKHMNETDLKILDLEAHIKQIVLVMK